MERSTELAAFSDYPYRQLPGERVTVWAGYPDIKSRLLRLAEAARSDRIGIYQFAVLHGEFGTGKSHAMRYLLNYIRSERSDEFKSIAVYLPRIAVQAKTDFFQLYRAIVDQLRPQLAQLALDLDSNLVATVDSHRATLGEQMADEASVRQRIRERLIEQDGGDQAAVLRAVLSLAGSQSAEGLKQLTGDSRTDQIHVDNDFAAVQALTALVSIATKPLFGAPAARLCFYLFLDEVEAIGDFSNSNAVSVNNGLRDVLNGAPEAFFLLAGFTGEAAKVEGLFEESVIARLTTDPIELPALDEENALVFLRDIHRAYRLPAATVDDDFPFDELGLRELIRRTGDRTPRQLLRNCRIVLEGAVLDGQFDGDAPISADAVAELLI